MIFGGNVHLDKQLLERCRKHARQMGYSSVEEFITHVLEKELKAFAQQTNESDESLNRLRGLGYIE